MRASRRFLLTAAVAMAATACGVPIESGAHFGRGYAPGRQATFAFNDEADHTQGDPRLQNNEFFHARLHESIEYELALRGIRYDPTNPDILVHHHLSLADHAMEEQVVDEAGVSTTQEESFEDGSVVVHLVDARTGNDLWVGWAHANIEPALVNPNSMRNWVYGLVGNMFEKWPVSSRDELSAPAEQTPSVGEKAPADEAGPGNGN
jgi:Domain of unknown function (DUF4136)